MVPKFVTEHKTNKITCAQRRRRSVWVPYPSSGGEQSLWSDSTQQSPTISRFESFSSVQIFAIKLSFKGSCRSVVFPFIHLQFALISCLDAIYIECRAFNAYHCCYKVMFQNITKLHERLVNTQSTLGSHAVWSASSQCEVSVDKISTFPRQWQRILWSNLADAQADLTLS